MTRLISMARHPLGRVVSAFETLMMRVVAACLSLMSPLLSELACLGTFWD